MHDRNALPGPSVAPVGERPGGDDVYGRRGVETEVGGDQWQIGHDRQLDKASTSRSW